MGRASHVLCETSAAEQQQVLALWCFKKKNVELTFAGPPSSLGGRAISDLITHFNRKTE